MYRRAAVQCLCFVTYCRDLPALERLTRCKCVSSALRFVVLYSVFNINSLATTAQRTLTVSEQRALQVRLPC